MPRLTRHELFLQTAVTVSLRGTCPRKQVGAVIVKNSHIVSMGYNGAPPGMPHCTKVGCGGGRERDVQCIGGKDGLEYPNGCTRAIHAEMNAIAFAARAGIPTDDAVMYSTCATCANCAALVVSSGICEFVYLEEYRLTEGIDLLREAGLEVWQWKQSATTQGSSESRK
jgi:dCMP deaminase